MSTTFNWTITSMLAQQQEGQYTDVVITANWNCAGVESGTGFTCNTSGACSFPAPGDSFTPYDQLTQDQVLAWCWSNGVNKTATEAEVQDQITKSVNPPVVIPPLPWAA